MKQVFHNQKVEGHKTLFKDRYFETCDFWRTKSDESWTNLGGSLCGARWIDPAGSPSGWSGDGWVLILMILDSTRFELTRFWQMVLIWVTWLKITLIFPTERSKNLRSCMSPTPQEIPIDHEFPSRKEVPSFANPVTISNFWPPKTWHQKPLVSVFAIGSCYSWPWRPCESCLPAFPCRSCEPWGGERSVPHPKTQFVA